MRKLLLAGTALGALISAANASSTYVGVVPMSRAGLAALTAAQAASGTYQHVHASEANFSADYDWQSTASQSCPSASYIPSDSSYICPSDATPPASGRWVRANSGSIFQVGSYSALSGLTLAQMSAQPVTYMSGYTSGSVLGGGAFTWIPAASAGGLTPTIGVIVPPSDYPADCTHGCLKRVVSGHVYSTGMFGVVGQSGSWSAQPLQTAITAVSSLPGNNTLMLEMDSGQCIAFSGTLSIVNPLHLTAPSWARGCLWQIGGLSGVKMMSADGTALGSSAYGLIIDNILLRSDNSTADGFDYKNWSNSTVDIEQYNTVDQVTIEGTRAYSWRITSQCITGCTGKGAYFKGFSGGGQLSLENSSFSGTSGIYIDQNSYVDTLNAKHINFESLQYSVYAIGSFKGLDLSESRTENAAQSGVAFYFVPQGTNSALAGSSICYGSGGSNYNCQSGLVAKGLTLNELTYHGVGFYLNPLATQNYITSLDISDITAYGLNSNLVQFAGSFVSHITNCNVSNNWSDYASADVASSTGFGSCYPLDNLKGPLGSQAVSGLQSSDSVKTSSIVSLVDNSGAGLSLTGHCTFQFMGKDSTTGHGIYDVWCYIGFPVTANVATAQVGWGSSPTIITGSSDQSRAGIVMNLQPAAIVGALQIAGSPSNFYFYKTGATAATNADLSGAGFYLYTTMLTN